MCLKIGSQSAARRTLTESLPLKFGPEVRSAVPHGLLYLVQASSWPSGLVPASAGKLTCAEILSDAYFFLYAMCCLCMPFLQKVDGFELCLDLALSYKLLNGNTLMYRKAKSQVALLRLFNISCLMSLR